MDTTPLGVEPGTVRQSTFGPSLERRATSRISWSSIFAGVAVSIGTWLMLHLLGMGIGLTAIDPSDAGTLKGVGIGTGAWSLIAPILALFVGGAVTGRVAGLFDRPVSAIHGGVVWALTTVVGAALLLAAISAAVGTGARMAGEAVERGAGLAYRAGAGMDGSGIMGALGLSSEDLIAPINRELREQGKPPVTPGQLQAATREVVRDGLRTGRLDREDLIRSIAQHTELTSAQASDVATRIEERWEAERQHLAGRFDAARHDALQAAETTGKGLLVVFVSMLLSLIAAGGGAVLGSMWWRRHVPTDGSSTTRRPVVTT